MFSLSELWSGEHQGRCKLLKPWWDVFMEQLLVLMLMVSVLAGTLLLSRDGLVCVPVFSNFSSNSGLDFQQYVYVSQVCYQEALPWFSRFLPYVTLLHTLVLLANGCFWFHFPLTSARIEHFLSLLAKCCESPWTTRALSHTAQMETRLSEDRQEETPKVHCSQFKAQRWSLDSGTERPLLAGSDSVPPSPCPSTPPHGSKKIKGAHSHKSRRSGVDSGMESPLLARYGSAPPSPCLSMAPPGSGLSISERDVPNSSSPGEALARGDRETARALFERVRCFRSHCESSHAIYKVYAAQSVFRVLKVVLMLVYVSPLLGSISFSLQCRPGCEALTGFRLFECSHGFSSILRKLMMAYTALLSVFGLLAVYALLWICLKSLRQYSFQTLGEKGWMRDAPDLHNDLAFLLHLSDQYDPLLSQRLSVFLSPVSETRLREESLHWGAERLRAMTRSSQRGRCELRLVALPRLPPALFSLGQLEVLKLELIQNATLTAQIAGMTALRELHLSHCGVSVEPGALLHLQERLETLHLSFTHPGAVPPWLCSLRALQELHLRGPLQRVPPELSELSLLKLEIQGEGGLVLTGLRRLTGLLELTLQGCELERLPPALLSLTALRTLDLQHNVLQELPALQPLRRLSHLRIAHNRLRAVPSSVGVLQALELLDLANNKLRSLPSALFTLRRLRRLLLAQNLLEELPAQIGALTLLSELDLSENRLERLPEELITHCVELRTLSLAHNSLDCCPAGLSHLSLLSRLDLRGNSLADLPLELGFCVGLRGGGLLAESWLMLTLPRPVRDVLLQPGSEPPSRPSSDWYPDFSTAQWSFHTALESRI